MPTILLVDDDSAVLSVIREHLAEVGFTVIAAPNTAVALGQFEAGQRVDLLLVDLVMPVDVADGLAFAKRVRKQIPDIPLIFMTGYYGFVARAGELPANVLYKPIDLDVLTQEIHATLDASPSSPQS